MIPYIDGISNITVTSGGGDKEDDEEYREKIRLSSSSRSVAGPKNAYKYFALSADTSIADANISSPSPGVVVITPILYGGGIPTQDILDKVLTVCSADDVRPLTDHVQVQAPNVLEYDVNLIYYVAAADEEIVVKNIEGTSGAINQYVYWQGSALERDINPDYLRKLVLSPLDEDGNLVKGANRVEITSPVYTELSATTVAKFSGNLTISHIVKG
jgi:phage-related baseplate assembly protein